jgi:hypothetical protein
MKEQRLLVTHEKMIELQLNLRDVNRQPKQVRRDFMNCRHASTANNHAWIVPDFERITFKRSTSYRSTRCNITNQSQIKPERASPTVAATTLRRYLDSASV